MNVMCDEAAIRLVMVLATAVVTSVGILFNWGQSDRHHGVLAFGRISYGAVRAVDEVNCL